MEERLTRALEPLAKEGDPVLVHDRLRQLLSPRPTLLHEDYTTARVSGLTISEAELAAAMAAALRAFGLDGLVSRLEQNNSPKHPHKLKRKRRKAREDPELKKKAKF